MQNSRCFATLRIFCLVVLWLYIWVWYGIVGKFLLETSPSAFDWAKITTILIIAPSLYGIHRRKPNFLWPLMISIVIGTPAIMILQGLDGYDGRSIMITIFGLAIVCCFMIVFISLIQHTNDERNQEPPMAI